jgi:hypothetical protein
MKVVSALLCNCVFSCSLYWLVSLLPLRDMEEISISQWAHAVRAAVASLTSLLVFSVYWSTTIFNRSSCDRGRFNRSACPLNQLNVMFMSLHQLPNNLCTIANRSESPFVLKNKLSVMGNVAANTAESLSHRNCTHQKLIRPDLKRVPSVASPTTMPLSSERYNDMRYPDPSSGPPPHSRFCSSLVAIIQP